MRLSRANPDFLGNIIFEMLLPYRAHLLIAHSPFSERVCRTESSQMLGWGWRPSRRCLRAGGHEYQSLLPGKFARVMSSSTILLEGRLALPTLLFV